MIYILIYNNFIILLLICMIIFEDSKIKKLELELDKNKILSNFLIMQFDNEVNYLKGVM